MAGHFRSQSISIVIITCCTCSRFHKAFFASLSFPSSIFAGTMSSEHIWCNAVSATDLGDRASWYRSRQRHHTSVNVCYYSDHDVNVSYLYERRSKRRCVLILSHYKEVHYHEEILFSNNKVTAKIHSYYIVQHHNTHSLGSRV